VLSGVKVGEHGMVGSMGVASKDVAPFTVVGGIPAKTDQDKIDRPRKSCESRFETKIMRSSTRRVQIVAELARNRKNHGSAC